MSKNSMNNDELDVEVEEVEQESPVNKEGERAKEEPQASVWKRLMRGDILGSSYLRHQLGLIIMIVVCLIIIVAMRYKVESLQKERIAVQDRIGVLREHKIQMQKKYQESVKISRIEEKLDTIGVGLISGPPYEI